MISVPSAARRLIRTMGPRKIALWTVTGIDTPADIGVAETWSRSGRTITVAASPGLPFQAPAVTGTISPLTIAADDPLSDRATFAGIRLATPMKLATNTVSGA